MLQLNVEHVFKGSWWPHVVIDYKSHKKYTYPREHNRRDKLPSSDYGSVIWYIFWPEGDHVSHNSSFYVLIHSDRLTIGWFTYVPCYECTVLDEMFNVSIANATMYIFLIKLTFH